MSNTGTELEIGPKKVDDAIELDRARRDDSVGKRLEATSSLDGNTKGELVPTVTWSPFEVGAARDALEVICETVSGSSIVVDEISEMLVGIVSRDVCVGKTSALERLALIVTLSEDTEETNGKDADSDWTIDEAAKDSATDAVEVNSVGKFVIVVSSRV